MRTPLKVLTGLALSALFLYLFLRDLDLHEVWRSLRAARVGLLLVAIGMGYFGHLLTRCWRWASMLRPLKARISLYNMFSTTAIGYALSWLVPLRLGEFARPVLLARREGMPAAEVLATAGIERILDAVTVFALAAAAAITTPLWWERTGPPVTLKLPLIGERGLVPLIAVTGALTLAGCVAGLLAARVLLREGAALPRWFERRAQTAVRPAVRAAWRFAGGLASGTAFLRDTPAALRIGAQSLVIWGVVGTSVWIGLLAAGVHIPYPGVYLMMVLSVFAIAIPTPGGMGPVQFVFNWGLVHLFGIGASLAAAATFLYHPVIVYIPPIVFGLFFAWRDGLSPSSLGELARQKDAGGAGGDLGGPAARGRREPSAASSMPAAGGTGK
jgi:uncharacterized membrane protein YbhN (UPF0104 family)